MKATERMCCACAAGRQEDKWSTAGAPLPHSKGKRLVKFGRRSGRPFPRSETRAIDPIKCRKIHENLTTSKALKLRRRNDTGKRECYHA
eukprot:5404845-Pleurochrysis_carterae.AAC.4